MENKKLFSVNITNADIEIDITLWDKEDLKQGFVALAEELIKIKKVSIADIEGILVRAKSDTKTKKELQKVAESC